MRQAGYVTDLLTIHVEDFVRGSRDRPFMVFLAHKALHPNIAQRDDGSTGAIAGQPEGFVPAARHRGRYADAVVPRRPNAGPQVLGKPALLRTLDGVPPLGPDTGTPDRDVRDRLEMLLAVDESVARVVRMLQELGELDRTVIVFTSDHGYFYGEHHLNEERRLAYEETIRIPLIVRYPPVAKAGTTPTQMVQTIDLAPTIVALARVDDAVRREGRSLVPLLRGEEVAVAPVDPGRVLVGRGVPADPQHGVSRGAHAAAQVHPLSRARRDGRTVRPSVRPVRDDQSGRHEGRQRGAARPACRVGAAHSEKPQ